MSVFGYFPSKLGLKTQFGGQSPAKRRRLYTWGGKTDPALKGLGRIRPNFLGNLAEIRSILIKNGSFWSILGPFLANFWSNFIWSKMIKNGHFWPKSLRLFGGFQKMEGLGRPLNRAGQIGYLRGQMEPRQKVQNGPFGGEWIHRSNFGDDSAAQGLSS